MAPRPKTAKAAAAPALGRTGTNAAGRDSGRVRWADDTPVNSDDARGRIVAAALECVKRYGVDKTGMDDVAKAASITRPTVYKYFATRNELIMAVFMRVLDAQLDRGLRTFFRGATTTEELHEAAVDAVAFMLGVLRQDEVTHTILMESKIPIDELLQEAAGMLVSALELAVQYVVEAVIANDLGDDIRPFDLVQASTWVIRVIYSYLVWPGPDPEAERAAFRAFLSPIFFVDP